MKTRIFIALCVLLGASFISARADDDTPEQAAARAALQQEMYALDHPQAQSSTNKNSTAAVAKSTGKSTIVTVATYAVTPQTAPAAIRPATAPTPVAPAAQAPVAITPAVVTPATNATNVSKAVAPAGATPTATPVATTSTSKVPVATTPEMAAALAAVQQKTYELNHPDTHSPPEPDSAATSTQPNEAAPHNVDTASAPATTTTTTVMASDPEAPAATPAAAPTQAAPVASIPATPTAAPVVKTPVAVIPVTIAAVTVPQATPPAVVVPIVKTPATTAPVAVAPVAKAPVAPVAAIPAVAHVAVAPKAVAAAPKLSTTPVVVAPVAVVRPVAAQARTQTAVASSIFKPALVLHAAPLPSSSPGFAKPVHELVTTTGSVYQNYEVERVMPDSIIISYTPAGGGWAMTKVNFSDLPAVFRQQYEKK